MKHLSIYIYLFVVILSIGSCQNTTNSSTKVLDPVERSLRKLFPKQQKVVFRGNSNIFRSVCPDPNPDSSNFRLHVVISDSLEIDEIALFLVQLRKFVEVEELGNKSTKPGEKVPLYTVKSELLFDEYYEPSSSKFQILIPSLFFEAGEYNLEYGIFLWKDSVNKELGFYRSTCKYLLESE